MIDDEIGDAEQSGKAAVQQRLEIAETASRQPVDLSDLLHLVLHVRTLAGAAP
jgi:hypothetical protein